MKQCCGNENTGCSDERCSCNCPLCIEVRGAALNTQKFYRRRNYGTDHEYILDEQFQAAVTALTGRSTLDEQKRRHLRKLCALVGVQLEWVEVPQPR